MLKRPLLIEQPIIRAMTRVPTIGGITDSFWGMMCLISVSAIVIFKTFMGCFMLLAVLYMIGRAISQYDLLFMNILMTRLSECPTLPNDHYWGCKSYDPF